VYLSLQSDNEIDRSTGKHLDHKIHGIQHISNSGREKKEEREFTEHSYSKEDYENDA
jgi:hypothetical protein